MPDTSISRVYKYLLSEQWFYTVSGTFLQTKSANMLGWNIFLIQGLSMPASPQIQTVKLPDKKPGISDKSSTMRRRSVKFQLVWQMLQKHVGSRDSYPKYQKSFVCLALYYESVRFIDTTTCRQLKLNLLSTEINFYCLMTNQTPALLVQRAPWTRMRWYYYSPSIFLAPSR